MDHFVNKCKNPSSLFKLQMSLDPFPLGPGITCISFFDRKKAKMLMQEGRQYLILHGGSTLESYWKLAVGLRALGVTCSIEMFLRCLLHPKMNTRLKFNLPWKEEYLQYLLWWALSGFHFQAEYLIFCTVHVVEFPGTQKVVPILKSQYFNSNLTTLLLRFH